jgi:hypothetical protein
MSFRKLGFLAFAGLVAACGAPVSQSVNPATLQPATASNGRVSPDAQCDYVKMEPSIKTLKIHQELGITPIFRHREGGECESIWLPAVWTNSGGELLIRKAGKEAIFSATSSSTYSVTAQVHFGSNSYTGQTTIIVLP